MVKPSVASPSTPFFERIDLWNRKWKHCLSFITVFLGLWPITIHVYPANITLLRALWRHETSEQDSLSWSDVSVLTVIHLKKARSTEPPQAIPTEELTCTNCFGGFNCTRLDVPLNWNATDQGGPRAAIAEAR